MRHRQRSYALQALYAYEQYEQQPLLESYEPFSFVQKSKPLDYSKELFYGVHRNLTKIDLILKKTLANWTLERLHNIDKCILRLSVYSLFFEETLPVPVVIDEAIELAKRYSEKKSPSFINGILDTIAKQKVEPC